jgi:hypothetical protein
MKIRNLVAGFTLAAAAATGLTACGTAHADVYPPAAYGENYGGHWHCYYVHDAFEATQLIRAGHCHYGDIPTLMPGYWHARYDNYYSWPGYYNHYVPAAYRSTYVRVNVNQFNRQNAGLIKRQATSARYVGKGGRIIPGTQVKPRYTSGTQKQRYGSGSSRTGSGTGGTSSRSRYGSGSSRTGQGSRSGSRSSSGGSSSGRSFGGGSSRRR